jgi:hypothetical protein
MEPYEITVLLQPICQVTESLFPQGQSEMLRSLKETPYLKIDSATNSKATQIQATYTILEHLERCL